jgi:hypothetical protein
MLRQRAGDRGRFGPHSPEIFAVLLALAAVAGIGVPFVLSTLESRGSDCLRHLVSEMDGPLPQDALCPKTGKSYAIATQGNLTVLGCPAPDGHLNSAPEFVRENGGPWRLRQIAAPSAGLADVAAFLNRTLSP